MEGRQCDNEKKGSKILNGGREGERMRYRYFRDCFKKSAHKAVPITYLEEFTMPSVLALTVLQGALKA